MKFKRTLLALTGLLLIATLAPRLTYAQWGVGASYEIRDEEPKNGFGLRIERGILKQLPIVDLGVRAHFSYFNEENQVDPQDPGLSSYGEEITDYDFGITALGGVSVGLLKPYIGLGLGSNSVNVDYSDAPQGFDDDSESQIYWNALAGAELSVTPILKPFVEYRYTDVGDTFFSEVESGNIPDASNGRIIFGVLLNF